MAGETFGDLGFRDVPASKRGPLVLLAGSGISLLLGLALLMVPWPSQAQLAQMTYAACHADMRTWAGCASALSPWLPFALLFGGAGGLYAGVRWLRK